MRWWEPQHEANNAVPGVPYTGEYYDGFQNKMTVKAVANPILADNVPSEDVVNRITSYNVCYTKLLRKLSSQVHHLFLYNSLLFFHDVF